MPLGEMGRQRGDKEEAVVQSKAEDKGFQIIVKFERSDSMIMKWEAIGTLHAGVYPYQLAALAAAFNVEANFEMEQRAIGRRMQAQQTAQSQLVVPRIKSFPRPMKS